MNYIWKGSASNLNPYQTFKRFHFLVTLLIIVLLSWI